LSASQQWRSAEILRFSSGYPSYDAARSHEGFLTSSATMGEMLCVISLLANALALSFPQEQLFSLLRNVDSTEAGNDGDNLTTIAAWGIVEVEQYQMIESGLAVWPEKPLPGSLYFVSPEN
jgi:hypothetical protein